MEIRAASIKYAKAKKSRSPQNDTSAIEKELNQAYLTEADKESPRVALKIKDKK